MKLKALFDREDGFTLLEVLVSFLIVSLVLASLLNAYSEGLSRIARAEKIADDTILLSSLIDRVGADLNAKPGIQDGETEDGRRWQVEITALPSESRTNRYQVAPHRVVASILETETGQPGRQFETTILARRSPAR